MADDVDALVASERLVEAAEMCARQKDFARASVLFERACEWERAASCALDAGDAVRSLELAILAKNGLISSTALAAVGADDGTAKRCAERLAAKGEHVWAAKLYEAAHQERDAALEWSRAGDAVRAAALFEKRSEPVEAARVLEAALRKHPEDTRAAVALGTLLLRYGKTEAAVRALQSVPRGAVDRRAALGPLADALAKLGMEHAAREARTELDELGGAILTPSPAPAEAKSRLYGRYDVVRQVASTASARVLECVDVVRQETVALKLFANDGRPGGRDAVARFEREIRALAALDHPNVVPMRDYFSDGPAIVLEWMSGGTLETMISTLAIAPARAIEIASAVLAALGEAHRLDILHRDVKPANVLFDAAGVTRLGDFGVAHLGDLTATATAGVIGTLAYMSPEQRRGDPATVASDIYGVGAMLLEMLTGEPGARDLASPRKLPSGAHKDLDARHDRVVLALVADDAAERPQSAIDARRSLLSVRWPTTVEPAAPVAPRAETHASERTARLAVDESGHATDTWTDRKIERLRLDDATKARAAIFARSGHRALQTIYRVDRAAGELWLEALAPLRSEIEPNSRALLQEALAAMDSTKASARIEPVHVGVRPNGELALRFSILQGSTIA